jgi:uncharacterized membrane protein
METTPAHGQKMPTTMKWILAVYVIGLVTGIMGVARYNPQTPGIGFGGQWWQIIGLLITVFLVIAILLRRFWKAILIILVVNLVVSVSQIVRMLSLPMAKIYELTGKTLPDKLAQLSPAELQHVTALAKMITAIPISLGLILAIAIFVYLYKHKSYFNGR